MVEIKPCPFCGGTKLRIRHSDIEGWIAHVECTECDDMLGPMSKYKYDDKEDASEDAIKVWNRRATDPKALSTWTGWDQSNLPWSEAKHKDSVCYAAFGDTWSMEDASAMISFIERTWTTRTASPSTENMEG